MHILSINYFDILQVIQKVLRISTLQFKYYWIKGHLDLDHTTEELNPEENMNIMADSMAQTFNRECDLHYCIMQKDEWSMYHDF